MEMISKKNKFHIGIFLPSMIVLFVCFCLFVDLYFDARFLPGTWINGVYCGGLDRKKVDELLLEDLEIPSFTIKGLEDEFLVDLSTCDYQYSFDTSLQNLVREQSLGSFIASLRNGFPSNSYNFSPVATVNAEKIENLVLNSALVKQAREKKRIYELRNTKEDGYFIYDEEAFHLDEEKALTSVLSAITSGKEELVLDDSYYTLIPLDAEQLKVKEYWGELEKALKCDLVYDMGAEQIAFSPAIMSGLLVAENGIPVKNEAGEFVISEEGIDAFVDDLADQYDTFGKPRLYQSTRGDLVTIEGGTYGTLLNSKSEKEFLHKAMKDASYFDGVEDVHTPQYKMEGYVRGLDDVGPNYIEVDMQEQKLYCHIDNKIVLTTDVVTGNKGRGWTTKEGSNFVYFMQRNRTLIGANYRTPVKFWMAVNGHIGIHDADWRDEFGGDIYLTSGSHGCINIPKEIMPDIYELYEEGTPVLMYYD